MTRKYHKKTDREKLVIELKEAIREYIILRDEHLCQKCLKYAEGSDLHISHVIPKSHGNILRYDDINLKILCLHCHLHWWHKNPLEASDWFREKFPKRWEHVQGKKNQYKKSFLLAELKDLRDRYKKLIKSIE